VAVLAWQGDLDVSSRELLRAALNEVPVHGADAVDAVVIDLSDVSFLDCSAAGILVAWAHRAGLDGVRVILAHPVSIVRRLLQALELDRALVVADTLEQAHAMAHLTDGRQLPEG